MGRGPPYDGAFPDVRVRGLAMLRMHGRRHGCGMSNYRRLWVPGGTYFFTVNLLERRRRLLVEHIDLLRASFRAPST